MTNNINKKDQLWRELTSSHALILMTYTVGVVVLAVLTAWLVSYTSTREAEKTLVEEGMEFAQLAAQSAVIPLLTGSKENSADFLNPLLSRRGVAYFSVFDQEQQRFFVSGTEQQWQPSPEALLNIHAASLLYEDNAYWHVAAPVKTEGEDSEVIGSVYVVTSKATIIALREKIISYTMWISAIAALLLWMLIYMVLRRVTLPIQRIAGHMDLSEGTAERQRIPSRVPSDVKTIYTAFNTMLDQIDSRDKALRDHVANMETIIEDKTHDLSEKNEQLEAAHNEAVAASHAKDIFVANVSHELRTPIQVIISYCDLLAEKYGDEELGNIRISSTQLLSLVNDILDLSKIESAKQELNVTTVSIRDSMTDIADAMLTVITHNNNTLKLDIADDIGVMATDLLKLTQIIRNMLSNAGRYTENGQVTLRLRKKTQDDAQFICFEVIDNGVGIAKDALVRIFEPFEQADMSTTRIHGGTGLGLAISAKLAVLLGGDLTVVSEPGQGSTFCLCLPKGVVNADEEPTVQNVAIKVVENLPKRILLAEDHPFICDAVKKLLEYDGHTVTVANDGQKALAILDKESFDVALIDVHMPKVDGVEVIRRYQQSNPNHTMKMFLLTADVTEALREQAEELQVSIMPKPISRAQLTAQINS